MVIKGLIAVFQLYQLTVTTHIRTIAPTTAALPRALTIIFYYIYIEKKLHTYTNVSRIVTEYYKIMYTYEYI